MVFAFSSQRARILRQVDVKAAMSEKLSSETQMPRSISVGRSYMQHTWEIRGRESGTSSINESIISGWSRQEEGQRNDGRSKPAQVKIDKVDRLSHPRTHARHLQTTNLYVCGKVATAKAPVIESANADLQLMGS